MDEQRVVPRTGRRQVVRAGVWSVPVIAVGVAAPVFAASGAAVLRFNGANAYGTAYDNSGRPTALQSQTKVENDYTPALAVVTSITVTVRYPDSRVNGAPPTGVSGAGWSYTSSSHVGAFWEYVFAWTGTLTSDPSQSTATLQFNTPLSNNAGGSFPVVFIADSPQAIATVTETVTASI